MSKTCNDWNGSCSLLPPMLGEIQDHIILNKSSKRPFHIYSTPYTSSSSFVRWSSMVPILKSSLLVSYSLLSRDKAPKKISWPVNVVEVLRNESKRTRLLFSIVSLPHLDQIFLLQKNLLYNKDPFPDRELILWKKSPNLQFSAREVRNHPSSSTACLCQFASP